MSVGDGRAQIKWQAIEPSLPLHRVMGMSIIDFHRRRSSAPTYVVVDRLHGRRAIAVPGDRIAATVSSWLAELGADSPLIDALASAAQCRDWPTVYALGERLSVEVMVA